MMKHSLLSLIIVISGVSWGANFNLQHTEICHPSDMGCRIGKYSLGAGVGWARFKSQTAFWPKVALEVGVLRHLALEVVAGTINSQKAFNSLSAAPSIILGAGLRIYPLERYHGPVINLAVMEHLYRQDFSNQRYSSQSALISSLGWRWRPKNSAGSLMLGAGVQRELEEGASFQPALDIQIGFDFNLEELFF